MSVSANLGSCFRQNFICQLYFGRLSHLLLTIKSIRSIYQQIVKNIEFTHFPTDQNFCWKGHFFVHLCSFFKPKLSKSVSSTWWLLPLHCHPNDNDKKQRSPGKKVTLAIIIKTMISKWLPSRENVWMDSSVVDWSGFVQLTKCSPILPPVG